MFLFLIIMKVMEYEFNYDVYLTGERVLLRPLNESDNLDFYYTLASDDDVLKYFVMDKADNPSTFQLDKMIESYRRTKRHLLAIIDKETTAFMGIVLQCNAPDAIFNQSEIGLALGKKYWHQGYGGEAASMFIELLFKEGIHKVFACHLEENKASAQVMKKCGMLYEGRRIDEIFYHDRYWNCIYYYIINNN